MILDLFALFGIFITVYFAPIIYIWCIKPNKSLKDGLRDWINESSEDI